MITDGDIALPTWLRLEWLPCWPIGALIAVSFVLYIVARWRQRDGLRKVAVNLAGAWCAIEAFKLMQLLFAA